MSGLEDLKNLRAVLTSLDTIISACEARATDFPSLLAPANPEAELSPAGIRNVREIADALVLGVSAAAQLVTTLQSPSVTIVSSSMTVRFFLTSLAWYNA